MNPSQALDPAGDTLKKMAINIGHAHKKLLGLPKYPPKLPYRSLPFPYNIRKASISQKTWKSRLFMS